MKFQGAKLSVREVVMVKLPRADNDTLVFKVAAIPMGLRRDYATVFPQPRPPVNFTSKVGGKQEREENWDDPNFIAAFDEWKYLQNIYTFYRVLELDENIQFETKVTDVVSLRAIEKELREAGISEGDMSVVLQQAAYISNITDRAISDAKANLP